MKLHRKIEHNEKVCRAHDLGSYAQGQGRNQVRGQNLVYIYNWMIVYQILITNWWIWLIPDIIHSDFADFFFYFCFTVL